MERRNGKRQVRKEAPDEAGRRGQERRLRHRPWIGRAEASVRHRCCPHQGGRAPREEVHAVSEQQKQREMTMDEVRSALENIARDPDNRVTSLPMLYRLFPEIKRNGVPKGYPTTKGLAAQLRFVREQATRMLLERERERMKALEAENRDDDPNPGT